MSVEFRDFEAHEFDELVAFLAVSGFERRVRDVENFRLQVKNATRNVVGVDQGRIVAFARALCDDAANGYISVVAVAPTHRRQGVGRRLIEHVTARQDHITWVLRAGRPGAREFWNSLGFVASKTAMERVRKE